MITKQCECCGKMFEKTKFTSVNKWATRKYCSRDCMAKAMIKHVIMDKVKVCEYCGIEYSQKETEHNSAFVIRKYCSRKCNCAAHKLIVTGVSKPHNKDRLILNFISNKDVPVSINEIKVRFKFSDIQDKLNDLWKRNLLNFSDDKYEITDLGDDFLCT